MAEFSPEALGVIVAAGVASVAIVYRLELWWLDRKQRKAFERSVALLAELERDEYGGA